MIVGHSLGGFLALWIASDAPDLTGPLVIVDALPFLPAVFQPGATAESEKTTAERMRAAMSKGGAAFEKQSEAGIRQMVTKPEDVETVVSWAKTTDPTAAADAMYDMFTTDLRDDVARIQSPVLVLGTWIAYRDNDADTKTRDATLANFESQYSKLKGVKIELADHARHFIMLDDPQWFYSQIDSFLK